MSCPPPGTALLHPGVRAGAYLQVHDATVRDSASGYAGTACTAYDGTTCLGREDMLRQGTTALIPLLGARLSF